MANAAQFEQDRTDWCRSHGYHTHDELEARIKELNPDLAEVSGLSNHINRYFKKHGKSGSFADVVAFVRADLG